MWRLSASLVLGVAVLGSAAILGCSKPEKALAEASSAGAASQPGPAGRQPGAQAAPLAVEVTPVVLKPVSESVEVVGSLRAQHASVLQSELGGRVVDIGLSDGARARRGQPLLRLDDSVVRAQWAQAQAQFAVAQAQHQRQQALLAQSFVSRTAVDQSAANLQVAQAQLAAVQAQWAKLRIHAPFAGELGLWRVSVGDYVQPGTALVSLEDRSHMDVDFQLPQRWVDRLQLGQGVELKPDEQGATPDLRGAIAARITALDTALNAQGRVLAVRARLDQVPPTWRSGMYVRVLWAAQAAASALVVPQEALAQHGQQTVVFRLTPEASGQSREAHRIAVQVGQRGAGWVAVSSPALAEGDVVVTAGHPKLKAEVSPVRVVTVEGSAAPASATTPGASHADR